ncbi:hypothetical protein RchiOBHm_Chr1g0372221 [Rosa chinensis]|uniref:Uncharacterized protein n=1 Tax=Rosa chinensis TaxID=74649 RepID=A0A2P6SLS2_ROSCH|nr:hypothetical protein RchiOBHm_Chr1g0372221 [Rosa chinensis]
MILIRNPNVNEIWNFNSSICRFGVSIISEYRLEVAVSVFKLCLAEGGTSLVASSTSLTRNARFEFFSMFESGSLMESDRGCCVF